MDLARATLLSVSTAVLLTVALTPQTATAARGSATFKNFRDAAAKAAKGDTETRQAAADYVAKLIVKNDVESAAERHRAQTFVVKYLKQQKREKELVGILTKAVDLETTASSALTLYATYISAQLYNRADPQ